MLFGLSPLQVAAFAIIFIMFVLFVWGRWRYDLVAIFTLLVATLIGVVPTAKAFNGFANPVIIIIASVLVVSKAISSSGILEGVVRKALKNVQSPSAQIGALTASVALLSAFVKNVGTLAIFMPIAVQVARRSKRSPSIYLMPLAFGSLIGGTITLIGTSSKFANFKCQTGPRRRTLWALRFCVGRSAADMRRRDLLGDRLAAVAKRSNRGEKRRGGLRDREIHDRAPDRGKLTVCWQARRRSGAFRGQRRTGAGDYA